MIAVAPARLASRPSRYGIEARIADKPERDGRPQVGLAGDRQPVLRVGQADPDARARAERPDGGSEGERR